MAAITSLHHCRLGPTVTVMPAKLAMGMEVAIRLMIITTVRTMKTLTARATRITMITTIALITTITTTTPTTTTVTLTIMIAFS